MDEHDVTIAGSRTYCDADRAGDLSIVVQGGLTDENLFQTSNNIRHWRWLFPAAQIILALSGSTILETNEADGELSNLRLAAPFALDWQMRGALAVLQSDCDMVVMAAPAVPLPRIKADSTLPNNINLQIAAAQAGLSRATGRYVLRVRSDLIFLDRGFLDQYVDNVDRPRGEAAKLHQRVLISWIYTLNPFTEERLPLHFSDWFHFGLRDDVVSLWNVAEMPLRDALFYQVHPYAAHSNAAERLFHTRLAVEQHVLVQAFDRSGAELRLRYHNELEPAVKSVEFLIDNFVLCEMDAAKCAFPKYDEEFYNHRKRTACITPDDWQALVAMRYIDPRIVLSSKILEVRDARDHEFRLGFPRHYAASQLTIASGKLSRGSIITHGDGLAAASPQIRLPPGDYFACLEVGPVEGAGVLRMTVMTNDNAVVVGEGTFAATTSATRLVVPFAITAYGVEDLKVICRSEAISAVTIYGLSIEKQNVQQGDRALPWFESLGREHSTTAKSLCFRSAAMAIRPGRYVAAVNLCASDFTNNMTLTAAARNGAWMIASRQIPRQSHKPTCCELEFDITDIDISDLVVSCSGENLSMQENVGLVIAQRSEESARLAFPRFYDAQMLRVGNGEAHDGFIASDGRNGVISYGPYVDLCAGRYTALVHLSGEQPKVLSVSITGQAGARQIATSTFNRRQLARTPTVPFEIGPGGMPAVEVVCRVRAPGKMLVTGVTLLKV